MWWNRSREDANGAWGWNTEFVGVPMSCNYYTFDVMSRVMKESSHIRGIVEFGTFTGGMAIYLGLLGLRAGVPVSTFDVVNVLEPSVERVLDRLLVSRHIGDIFSLQRQRDLEHMLRLFPVYIVMDNGDKPREFREFVPMLQSGSVISVHDYGVEFQDKDWEGYGDFVEPYLREEWRKHDVRLASFRKK